MQHSSTVRSYDEKDAMNKLKCITLAPFHKDWQPLEGFTVGNEYEVLGSESGPYSWVTGQFNVKNDAGEEVRVLGFHFVWAS